MIPQGALQGHIGNLGKTGSGKTYTTKAEVVEPLLDAGRQVAIVDPTSAWWGLRLMPDGKKPSPYPIIILGGPHGDLPLVASSGAACARLVTEQLASVVFDTAGMTVADRTRWFTAFAGELYRTVAQPLTVVIDEVHCFAPQARKLGPDEAMMLHAASELFSGGRSRGLRMIGLSQRPAKWHKDSLTSVDALMLHRVLAPQDRDAAKEWIDGCGDPARGKEVLGTLAGLKKGEYWFWWPEGDALERRQSPRIKTFDSSATPVHGAPRVDVQRIDLGQVKAALAEAVKEAEANDPRHLRARIEELEGDLAAALAGGEPDPDANGRSAMQAEIDRLDAEAAELTVRNAKLAEALKQARASYEELVARQDRIRKFVMDQTIEVPPVPAMAELADHGPAESVPMPVFMPHRTGQLPEGIGGSHLRVLQAVARWQNAKLEATTLRVAVLAGYAADSGNFNNLLGKLSSSGLIVRANGAVTITDEGLHYVTQPIERVNRPLVAEAMLSLLKGRHREALTQICIGFGKSRPSKEIASEMGLAPKSGNFNNLLGYLSGRKLIVRENGTVRVNPELVI